MFQPRPPLCEEALLRRGFVADVFADKPTGVSSPDGFHRKFALGNVAKLFGYALYPFKRGVRAIRK